MGIIVTIDEKLAEDARKLTGLADATAAIEHILREATEPKQTVKSMFDLVGKVHIREDYDYKSMRAGDAVPD